MKRLLIFALILVTLPAFAETYTGLNLSNRQWTFADGDVLIGCNCQQERPHTPFAEGVKGLTFQRCNLENADVPEDARVEDCLVVHMDSIPVLTISVAEYDKRQADVEAATKAAEAAVLAQPVKVDLAKTVSVGDAIEDADQRKAVAADAAMVTLRAAWLVKDGVSLEGTTPKPDLDERGNIVSWTYSRRERVP